MALRLSFILPLLFVLNCKSSLPIIDYNTITHKVDLNRFEKTIAKFEEQDKVARYSNDLILFTGSSSIVMWKSLAEDMAPHSVLNRGFGGSILPEINHYFERVVKKYQPKIIFLYCGENDIELNYTPEESYSAYLKFIDLCSTDLPQTEIVFISMKPSPSRWDKWQEVDKANKLIKTYISKHNHLHFIDVGPVMMSGSEPDKTIFIKDMLHMNEEGYKRWTKVIKPVLDKINTL